MDNENTEKIDWFEEYNKLTDKHLDLSFCVGMAISLAEDVINGRSSYDFAQAFLARYRQYSDKYHNFAESIYETSK